MPGGYDPSVGVGNPTRNLDRQLSQALHTAQDGNLSQMAEDVVAHLHPQHPTSASRAAECLDIIVESLAQAVDEDSSVLILPALGSGVQRVDRPRS